MKTGTPQNVPVTLSKEEGIKAFEAIYNNISTGITLVSKDGTLMYVNNAFHKILDYEPGSLHNVPVEEITHPDDVSRVWADLQNLVKGKFPNYTTEKRCISSKGAVVWCQLDVSPLIVDGEFKYAVAIVHDINLRKKAQEENKQLFKSLEQNVANRTAQLKAANEELEAFSYSVSHDLRAPLRAVAGYTSILKEDYLEKFDEDGREILDYIINNTHKMGRLIDELLEFSRMQRKVLVNEKFSLNNLVKEVTSDLSMAHKQLKIHFNIKDLPDAYGDPILIRQVFQNLLDNAIKFSSKREVVKIEIAAKENEKEVLVTVKDNGVGFDMKYYDKIFGVFQRLHGENEFSGSGVGLALVQRIIRKHEGRIWAESEIGNGATFYFTIPNKRSKE